MCCCKNFVLSLLVIALLLGACGPSPASPPVQEGTSITLVKPVPVQGGGVVLPTPVPVPDGAIILPPATPTPPVLPEYFTQVSSFEQGNLNGEDMRVWWLLPGFSLVAFTSTYGEAFSLVEVGKIVGGETVTIGAVTAPTWLGPAVIVAAVVATASTVYYLVVGTSSATTQINHPPAVSAPLAPAGAILAATYVWSVRHGKPLGKDPDGEVWGEESYAVLQNLAALAAYGYWTSSRKPDDKRPDLRSGDLLIYLSLNEVQITKGSLGYLNFAILYVSPSETPYYLAIRVPVQKIVEGVFYARGNQYAVPVGGKYYVFSPKKMKVNAAWIVGLKKNPNGHFQDTAVQYDLGATWEWWLSVQRRFGFMHPVMKLPVPPIPILKMLK